MIFDGRTFAKQIEEEVKNKVTNLVGKPKIVSILVGNDPASELYTRLKKQAAERVGIQFEVVRLAKINPEIVKEIAEREDVTGVMIQLPLPEEIRGETFKLIEAIPLRKDVDGLRWIESGVISATVRAVLTIIDQIAVGKTKFVVIGSRGTVGKPLVHFLKKRGVEVGEVEWDSPEPTKTVLVGEVVISCVGKAGVVSGEMVSTGVIVIDVGAPTGDMTKEVYQKASVSVEVPGGVGPVTIACLLNNVVEMYGRKARLV